MKLRFFVCWDIDKASLRRLRSISLLGKLPGHPDRAAKLPILLPADDRHPAASLPDKHHVVAAVFLAVTRIR